MHTNEVNDMITIAACDDKEQDLQKLIEYIDKEFTRLQVQYKIIPCSNGQDLLYVQDEVGKFDIVFLDIELERDNGIEVAQELKKNNPCCQIIFVSGYNRYYKEAFRVQPFQFVDKPIKKEEIIQVIQDVAEVVIDNDEVFSFEYKWQQYRILLKDILYFVSDSRMIFLFTQDGKKYEFYGKLSDVEEDINKQTDTFLRVHKSYLINMTYIKIFNSEKVIMQDDKVVQISTRKRKSVMEAYMRYAL